MDFPGSCDAKMLTPGDSENRLDTQLDKIQVGATARSQGSAIEEGNTAIWQPSLERELDRAGARILLQEGASSMEPPKSNPRRC